uniref:GCFC domain-containing protein n=1 Tax=Rhabditophanes sp. KR3021 TaxID=114890 RepID=A0AC35TGG1_9BILA
MFRKTKPKKTTISNQVILAEDEDEADDIIVLPTTSKGNSRTRGLNSFQDNEKEAADSQHKIKRKKKPVVIFDDNHDFGEDAQINTAPPVAVSATDLLAKYMKAGDSNVEYATTSTIQEGEIFCDGDIMEIDPDEEDLTKEEEIRLAKEKRKANVGKLADDGYIPLDDGEEDCAFERPVLIDLTAEGEFEGNRTDSSDEIDYEKEQMGKAMNRKTLSLATKNLRRTNRVADGDLEGHLSSDGESDVEIIGYKPHKGFSDMTLVPIHPFADMFENLKNKQKAMQEKCGEEVRLLSKAKENLEAEMSNLQLLIQKNENDLKESCGV